MGKGNFSGNLQKFAKSLMTPVAVLPAAALLLRIGSKDLLNISWMEAGGNAVFENIALIFAIGVAIGLAKDNNGVAGIAAAVGYLVLTSVAKTFNKDIDMGVLAGIVSGLLAGYLYNKYHKIRVPDFLGFFGGKRFVPIITSLYSMVIGVLAGYIWPVIQTGIDNLGNALVHAGSIGLFFYGFLNRILVPTGLHQILNTIVNFQIGTFTNVAGHVVHGDLLRYYAGDPNGGMFTAGGYAVTMIALPFVCLAMYKAAKPEKRKAVSGLLISAALTAFLTGVTEPIEFSFMFVSPILLVVHAVIMGLANVIVAGLGVRLGVSFSNGLMDYLLTYGAGTKQLLVIPVGIVAGLLYYFIFYYVIVKFNVPTPGRTDDADDLLTDVDTSDDLTKSRKEKIDENTKQDAEDFNNKARNILQALGGNNNITDLDACITRIRVSVVDSEKVDESKLKENGATGIVKLGKNNYQVVVGTIADPLVSEMKELK
ncbi:PTS acetylglucosamine transporter subunit IIB [Ligilactobacillus pabuli]|uniref:PTS acetylglucosamine transporter subunit IIB n=2 Tax=Ligilactobacillus pabuli TaxID=2886039 RepID=A0ABQ5JKX6_9LACO|nr:PTS acetylglucosamine transporter subunit IIB [Ligilactobacillus pabuli]